jgi:hypothetical protein
MDNFDIRKFLTEHKITAASQQLSEDNIDELFDLHPMSAGSGHAQTQVDNRSDFESEKIKGKAPFKIADADDPKVMVTKDFYDAVKDLGHDTNWIYTNVTKVIIDTMKSDLRNRYNAVKRANPLPDKYGAVNCYFYNPFVSLNGREYKIRPINPEYGLYEYWYYMAIKHNGTKRIGDKEVSPNRGLALKGDYGWVSTVMPTGFDSLEKSDRSTSINLNLTAEDITTVYAGENGKFSNDPNACKKVITLNIPDKSQEIAKRKEDARKKREEDEAKKAAEERNKKLSDLEKLKADRESQQKAANDAKRAKELGSLNIASLMNPSKGKKK